MSCSLSQPVADTVEMLLKLNVTTSSRSTQITWTKSKITTTYTQQLTPAKQFTLLHFLLSKEPSITEADHDVIVEYIKEECKIQLENVQKTTRIRRIVGILYFWFAPLWPMILKFAYGTPLDVSQAVINWSSILWFCGVLLLWFNRIYFPKIRKAIKENKMTLALCNYVYDELPKRKLIRVILFILSAVLIVVSILLPRLAV